MALAKRDRARRRYRSRIAPEPLETGWPSLWRVLFLLEGALQSEPNETARAAG